MNESQLFEYELDAAELTAEQVLADTRQIWADMKTQGSQARAALLGLGVQPAELPANVGEVLSIKGSGAGMDAATITLIVVAVGGAIGAKLPVMVGDIWKYVILPQLRHRWGDKALAEKAKKTTSAADDRG